MNDLVGRVVVLVDMPALLAASDGDADAAASALIVAGPIVLTAPGQICVRGQTPAGGPDACVVVSVDDDTIGMMPMFKPPSLLAAATRIEAAAAGGALVTTHTMQVLVTASADGAAVLAPAPTNARGPAVTVANAAAVVGGSVMTKATALCIAAQIAANARGTLQA
jgi:hypothetical protein